MNSAKYNALLSKYSTLVIFIIPALTIFTLFVVLPIIEAAYYSFYRWDGYGDPNKYVGLKNYKYLFKNKTFILTNSHVINGKEKGKTGEVLKTIPYENRVVVKGINLRTKHVLSLIHI